MKSEQILAMTFGCGVAVASAYYIQPILNSVGQGFGMPPSLFGILPMLVQFGLALGVILIVPGGDIWDPKKLILASTVFNSICLFSLGLLSSPLSGLLGCFFLGLSTVTPYLIPPLASSFVVPERRGAMVGSLASGTFAGILLSRVVSGAIAETLGWRWVYLIAGGVMAALSLVLYFYLPVHSQPKKASLSYRALLGSLLKLIVKNTPLRRTSWSGGLSFAAFTVFWLSLSSLLTSEHFRMGSGASGSFGLIGFLGSLVAPQMGKLIDKKGYRYTVRLTGGLNLSAWVILVFAQDSLLLLVVGALLLDLGVTTCHIASQTRIYVMGKADRGRMTAIYLLFVFACAGAISPAVSFLWAHFNWYGVCALGLTLAGAGASLSWLKERAIP